MAWYPLLDLHLSFSVNKPMDIFDPVWKDHERKTEKCWRKKITPERRPFSPETIHGEEM